MVMSIIGFLLAGLGLVALALQRFYSSVPAKELRRLAARGDQLAMALYRAVAYGGSLRLFLWIIVSSGLTGGILLMAQSLPAWAAFLAVAGVLLIGFVVLQSARLTVRTASFAAFAAPALGTVLGRIEPLLGRVTHSVHRHRKFVPHSGMYEKEDLTDLLDQQRNQVDNRISHEELELARRALHFDDTQAADILLPCSSMKTLKAGDAIGPILLEELHASGQTIFVVYNDEGARPVGTLRMQEAVEAKAGGKVADIMSKDLVYVHEDFTLRQVLDVCLKTDQPLALVINGFEELVGVISLETLVRELFGATVNNEGSELAYQDRAAVAAYKPAEKSAEKTETTVQTEESSAAPTAEKLATDTDSPEAVVNSDSSSETPEVVE